VTHDYFNMVESYVQLMVSLVPQLTSGTIAHPHTHFKKLTTANGSVREADVEAAFNSLPTVPIAAFLHGVGERRLRDESPNTRAPASGHILKVFDNVVTGAMDSQGRVKATLQFLPRPNQRKDVEKRVDESERKKGLRRAARHIARLHPPRQRRPSHMRDTKTMPN
jgi:hypothetical protein